MRLTYPGACSLEYQNIIKIVIEDLLQWDIKKQIAKGVGIIRTVEALALANEEQGRPTLHSHWQCWTKDLSQKLRDQLFDNDEELLDPSLPVRVQCIASLFFICRRK